MHARLLPAWWTLHGAWRRALPPIICIPVCLRLAQLSAPHCSPCRAACLSPAPADHRTTACGTRLGPLSVSSRSQRGPGSIGTRGGAAGSTTPPAAAARGERRRSTMADRPAKQQKLEQPATPANVIIQFQSPEGGATGALLAGRGLQPGEEVRLNRPASAPASTPLPYAPCRPAGPQLDVPHDVTPAQLETLLNGLLQARSSVCTCRGTAASARTLAAPWRAGRLLLIRLCLCSPPHCRQRRSCLILSSSRTRSWRQSWGRTC